MDSKTIEHEIQKAIKSYKLEYGKTLKALDKMIKEIILDSSTFKKVLDGGTTSSAP